MADTTTPARSRITGARICTILGFVFAVLAVFFVPLLLGIVAVVLGLIGAVLGDKPLGWYAAAAGVVGGILGVVLASLLLGS